MEKLSHEEKKALKLLEKKLGFRFWDRTLLRQSLTHRSFFRGKKEGDKKHNERLEFLGDAVLQLIISHILYDLYPDLSEGELTRFRSALVNEKSLAFLAKNIDLGKQLYLSYGEEKGKGREKESLLSDAYEAVLGAFYLDRGFKKVFRVIRNHFGIVKDQVEKGDFYRDYKSELQEKVQALYRCQPRYELIDQTGPEHKTPFKVKVYIQDVISGDGEGKTKKEAEQLAAKEALEGLKGKTDV